MIIRFLPLYKFNYLMKINEFLVITFWILFINISINLIKSHVFHTSIYKLISLK